MISLLRRISELSKEYYSTISVLICNRVFIRSSFSNNFYRHIHTDFNLIKIKIYPEEYRVEIIQNNKNITPIDLNDMEQDESYLVLKYGKILLEEICG
mgnify:CR=1 FL=1